MLVVLSPLIAMIGAIRWNIRGQLDADLAMILTVFCDTVLLFLLLLPLAETGAKSKVVDWLYRMVTTKIAVAAWLLSWLAILAFVFGAIAAFHYLISLLFEALFGKG